jgi:hypothetical protein
LQSEYWRVSPSGIRTLMWEPGVKAGSGRPLNDASRNDLISALS